MRSTWVFVAVAGALLMCSGDARAAWSPPQTTPIAGHLSSALAVNARGDTAIAWVGHSGTFQSSVHLTIRTPEGTLRTRRVWASRRASTGGIAVAIDGRGEVTVAWIVNTRRNQGGITGPGKIYVAYGPAKGHWQRPRALGRALASPRLAVAPHGRVLLLWVYERSEKRRVAAAWRARGHRFSRRQRLKKPAVVSTVGEVSAGLPAFDQRGAAYVAGECEAVVLRARRDRRRFTTILDHDSALGFNLSLAGPGLGLASLVRGRCTTDASAGNTPGPVFATVLRGAKFGPEIALPSNDQAIGTRAVALNAGGGVVSWSGVPSTFSVPIGANGAVGAPQPAPLGIVPFTRNGGGDQVLAGRGSAGRLVQFGVLVRPVEGGPDQPAPTSFGTLAVSAPLGRTVALAWNTSPTGGGGNLALSVWRP